MTIVTKPATRAFLCFVHLYKDNAKVRVRNLHPRREVRKRKYHPGARPCLPTWVTLVWSGGEGCIFKALNRLNPPSQTSETLRHSLSALGRECISFIYHRPGDPWCRDPYKTTGKDALRSHRAEELRLNPYRFLQISLLSFLDFQ